MLSKLQLGLNPIIVKELRSRMRDSRAFVTLTIVLLLLGGSSYLLYRIALAATQYSYSSMPISPQIGQSMFIALAFLELMMVSAIAPAVTAGAISGEKEKLTYEMLMATPLRPASILWGKLISALSYVFLLIFAAIPMASLIFIFGGVTPRDMVKALVILVVVAITLGVLGMFMSTWLGRTARATVVSYLVVAALYVLPVIVYVAVGIFQQAEPPRWILVASPLSALFSAVTPSVGGGDWNFLWVLGMGLGGNMRVLAGAGIDLTGIPRPLYHYSLPLYGVLTLVLYYFSTHLVLPTRRWKLNRKEILITLLVVLAFTGLVSLGFMVSSGNYGSQSIFAVPTPMGFDGPAGMRQAEVRAVQVVPLPYPEPDQVSGPYPAPNNGDLPKDVEVEWLEVEIYTALVRHLYLIDNVAGIGVKPAMFPVVHLEVHTNDSVGDPNAPIVSQDSFSIPAEVQQKIIEMLVDEALPAKIEWVENIDLENFTPENATLEDGAAIVFGNIHIIDSDKIIAAAAIYSSEGARGSTYMFDLTGDRWVITGNTGGEWIR